MGRPVGGKPHLQPLSERERRTSSFPLSLNVNDKDCLEQDQSVLIFGFGAKNLSRGWRRIRHMEAPGFDSAVPGGGGGRLIEVASSFSRWGEFSFLILQIVSPAALGTRFRSLLQAEDASVISLHCQGENTCESKGNWGRRAFPHWLKAWSDCRATWVMLGDGDSLVTSP